MSQEETVAIIKPDAVRRGVIGTILYRAERELQLAPIALQMRVVPMEVWTEFYSDLRDRSFFPGLIEFMASGPSVLSILSGPNAISAWRRCIGATDPSKADTFTLRRMFGTEGPANAVHGSDSPESALREAKILGLQYPASMVDRAAPPG